MLYTIGIIAVVHGAGDDHRLRRARRARPGRDRGGRQGRQPRRAAAGPVARRRRRAQSGGDIALALFSAAAFATILAVVAGLVIASAGAIAHDLWANVMQPRHRGGRAQASRVIAVDRRRRRGDPRRRSPSAPGFNVTVLVSMAFVFAASANFPPLLLALFWRRFNTAGALTGIAFGIIASVGDDRAQPAGVAGPGLAGLAVVADVPGPGDDPDRLPRLLAGHDAQPLGGDDERTYDELLVRSELGIGAEGGPADRPPLPAGAPRSPLRCDGSAEVTRRAQRRGGAAAPRRARRPGRPARPAAPAAGRRP